MGKPTIIPPHSPLDVAIDAVPGDVVLPAETVPEDAGIPDGIPMVPVDVSDRLPPEGLTDEADEDAVWHFPDFL